MPYSDRLPTPGVLSSHWALNPQIVFLNHGSFGACPLVIQQEREKLLRLIEADPMEFLLERHQPLLRNLTDKLERFTGAQKDSIVMVENTTTGVNTVLRNLPVKAGDTLMVTDQEYFSSWNALRVLAEEKDLRIETVEIPWPASEDSVLEAFDKAARPGIRFALVDHIVSASGIVLPLKKMIDLLKSRGIETVVDGAHGPGQLDLNLCELGCVAYTGNCHKWLCSPRSAAILYVRPDFQEGFRPLVVSHLPGEIHTELSDYQMSFSWNGTPDPTPALAVPSSIDFIGGLFPGGWEKVMEENREKTLRARRFILSHLGLDPPCPDSMVGSMAAIPLEWRPFSPEQRFHQIDPVQRELLNRFQIVVPVTRIRNDSVRLLRISAQLYNSEEQYEYLARSMKTVLEG